MEASTEYLIEYSYDHLAHWTTYSRGWTTEAGARANMPIARSGQHYRIVKREYITTVIE